MSFTRTNEPSGFARTTISPNSSGVCSRPRAHSVSEFLSAWNWFAADLPGGIHSVLLLHCGDDVRHSDAKLRELIRLDPQAHRVLASAENLHIPYSRHACQWIEEINVAVIGEKGSVVAAFG